MMTPGTRTVTTACIRRLSLLLITLFLLLGPLLYTVAGFFLLPYALNNYLTTKFAGKTGYQVQVGDIRFNPFSWQLGIDNFSMQDAGNRVLLAFTSLELDYDGLSIFQHELGIESLRLAGPQLDLSVSADGELLLATVFSRLGNNDNDATKDTAMPALRVKELIVQEALLDVETAQLARPYRQNLSVKQLRVHDFHTVNEGHANSLYAEIGLGKGSTATISGNISLTQSLASVRIKLSQFDLQPLLQALDLPFRGHIARLPFDLATAATIHFGNKAAIYLKDTDVRLHDIRIAATADAAALADIPLLHVQGVAVDLHKQMLAIDKLAVHDGKLQLAIDKQGQHNWQALLPAEAENTTAPAASAATAWQLQVKQLQVINHSLQWHSEQTATPVDLLLAPINLTLTDFQPLKPEQAFALTVDAGLPEQGTLALAGQLQLQPLQLAATLKMQSVALPLAQAYISELAVVDVKQGLLAAELKLNIQQQAALQVQADGNIRVDDFQLYPQGSKKKLLAWQLLHIPQFSYALPANRLDIASIDLNRFYGRLTINANGKTNLQNLLIASTDITETAETASEAVAGVAETSGPHQPIPALGWTIGAINIIDGETAFADLSLRPSFKTSIRNMSGNIRQVSSSPDQLATVRLKGKVDEYAPVNIAGTFNLLAEQPQLDMALDFRNIELTSFSPYSGVYAGYKIDKGQLSMDLQYTLVDQRIKGKNHIVINQLVFGDKVESTKAIDLPLKLAIALLSDENGIIDLGFGVKGDLDSPEFSINDIIWKAVYELLKKTVTAPFTYLGRLFKTGQENVQALDFAPGSEMLSDEASEKLATVAKMMKSKKMLQLNIQGNALPAIDKPVLQEQELMQILSVETRQPPELFLPAANAAANDELYTIVADYYAKQRGEPLSAVAQRLAGEGLADSELKQSVYAAAWQELVDTTPVTSEDINRLALRRARQAKALLVEKHQIDAGRVFVLDSKAAAIAPSLQTRLSVDAR